MILVPSLLTFALMASTTMTLPPTVKAAFLPNSSTSLSSTIQNSSLFSVNATDKILHADNWGYFILVRDTYIQAVVASEPPLLFWDRLLAQAISRLRLEASLHLAGERTAMPDGQWTTDCDGTIRFGIERSYDMTPGVRLTYGVAIDVCVGLRALGPALGYRPSRVFAWVRGWDRIIASAWVGFIGPNEAVPIDAA